MLYRADEIEVGDQLVGFALPVRRVEARGDEIDLYCAIFPLTFITVGAGTEVLAEKPARYGVPTVALQSQARSA